MAPVITDLYTETTKRSESFNLVTNSYAILMGFTSPVKHMYSNRYQGAFFESAVDRMLNQKNHTERDSFGSASL